jgi:hypothetical protein
MRRTRTPTPNSRAIHRAALCSGGYARERVLPWAHPRRRLRAATSDAACTPASPQRAASMCCISRSFRTFPSPETGHISSTHAHAHHGVRLHEHQWQCCAAAQLCYHRHVFDPADALQFGDWESRQIALTCASSGSGSKLPRTVLPQVAPTKKGVPPAATLASTAASSSGKQGGKQGAFSARDGPHEARLSLGY